MTSLDSATLRTGWQLSLDFAALRSGWQASTSLRYARDDTVVPSLDFAALRSGWHGCAVPRRASLRSGWQASTSLRSGWRGEQGPPWDLWCFVDQAERL